MPRRKKKISGAADPAPTYDRHLLGEISGTGSPSERSKALSWLADQGESTQIEVIRKRDELLHHKRLPGAMVTPELSLGCLVLAAKILRRDEEALALKARLTEAQAGDVSRRRMDKFKTQRKGKRSPKYEMIRVQFYELITDLLEKKFSLADISLYLYQYHKFPITRGHLQKCLKKINAEKAAGTAGEETNEL